MGENKLFCSGDFFMYLYYMHCYVETTKGMFDTLNVDYIRNSNLYYWK